MGQIHHIKTKNTNDLSFYSSSKYSQDNNKSQNPINTKNTNIRKLSLYLCLAYATFHVRKNNLFFYINCY